MRERLGYHVALSGVDASAVEVLEPVLRAAPPRVMTVVGVSTAWVVDAGSELERVPNLFVSPDQLSQVVRQIPGVVWLGHVFASKLCELPVDEQVRRIHETSGGCLDGYQINGSAGPEVYAGLRQNLPDVRLVLAIGRSRQRGLAHHLKSSTNWLQRYCGLVDDLLLDDGYGPSRPLDLFEREVATLYACDVLSRYRKLRYPSVRLAGNLGRYLGVVRFFLSRLEFGWEVESRLRRPRPDYRMVPELAMSYLNESYRLIQQVIH